MDIIISWLINFALNIINRTGYGGLFILSLLESTGFLIPSEVVLPFSGFLASSGQFVLWIVAVLATLGNLIGSIILYGIGASGGRWLLEKYGRYVLISKREIDTGDRWFARHGLKAVFFGRMLPVVRTFISLPAGMARVNFKKFVLFTFLGALPWNFVLAYVGYKTGEHWEFLHPYFQKLNIAIVGMIIVAIVWYIVRHLKKNQH